LDISSRPSGRRLVLSGGERGLLSMVFHPNFSGQGRGANTFYIYYTSAPNGASVLSEWELDETQTVPAEYQEKIILTFPQPYANHNGGTILFGPDGYLYLTLGDGGAGNDPHGHAQDPHKLYGKILRIDPNSDTDPDPKKNFAIPPTNPYANGTYGLPEVYTIGMRNPWRCSFGIPGDHSALICSDVGQNKWEKITIIRQPGEDHGWRNFEAMECNSAASTEQECQDLRESRPDLVFPVFYYRNAGAIIGAFTYVGTSDPRLNDYYIFADVAFAVHWDNTLKYYKTDGIGEPPRMMGVKPPGWASLTAELREPQPWVCTVPPFPLFETPSFFIII
jgi:glucose/arabinose dehydrogenase